MIKNIEYSYVSTVLSIVTFKYVFISLLSVRSHFMYTHTFVVLQEERDIFCLKTQTYGKSVRIFFVLKLTKVIDDFKNV